MYFLILQCTGFVLYLFLVLSEQFLAQIFLLKRLVIESYNCLVVPVITFNTIIVPTEYKKANRFLFRNRPKTIFFYCIFPFSNAMVVACSALYCVKLTAIGFAFPLAYLIMFNTEEGFGAAIYRVSKMYDLVPFRGLVFGPNPFGNNGGCVKKTSK